MRLPYVIAQRDAPDRYRLTESVDFTWAKIPAWAGELAGLPWRCNSGYILVAGIDTLVVRVYAGFHFAVTVAPSFRRALPGACLHDWGYQHASEIAAAWGCSRRDVLRLFDYWFLAQMSASQFLLKRTYFAGVRLFGHAFNSLFKGK